MKNWHDMGKRLNDLIRPSTFPIALKLFRKSSDFPEKVRRPLAHLGIKIPVCQALSMVRIYGWTVGMTAEESINCAGKVVFGWRTPNDEETLINGWVKAGFMENERAAKETLNSLFKLQDGEYEGLVMSPLEKTRIDPDLIMVYCNPAQITPLINSITYKNGGKLHFSSQSGVESCSDGIAQTILTGRPNVVLPGIGDRALAMTQNDELIFTVPASMLESSIEGLEVCYKKGLNRYPVPIHLRYQGSLPWERR
jgi:uncharacterized protein (DUF169 family)